MKIKTTDQLPKQYFSDTITLAAGARQNRAVGDSDYFGILEVEGVNADSVEVSFDRSGGTREFFAGTGHRFDGVFSSVEFYNSAAVEITVTYVCAVGTFDDNRATIAGEIDVNFFTNSLETSELLVAGTIDGNSLRREIILTPAPANTGLITYSSAGGVAVPIVGDSLRLFTTDDIVVNLTDGDVLYVTELIKG